MGLQNSYTKGACHIIAAFFRCLLTKDFTSGVLSGLARVTMLQQTNTYGVCRKKGGKHVEIPRASLNNKSLAIVSESIGTTFWLPLPLPLLKAATDVNLNLLTIFQSNSGDTISFLHWFDWDSDSGVWSVEGVPKVWQYMRTMNPFFSKT